jgi:pimeloyl-ACP methyl ester carboxylesterase
LDPEFLKSFPLTIDQMKTDGIRLSEYLIRYLGKQKIILFGTSWGSILGVLMAVKRPDLFCAYIGHSQIVNPFADLVFAYQHVYEMAKKASDSISLETLKRIGEPPYDSAKTTGKLLRVIKQYERKNPVAPPDSLWKIEPSYDNAKDEQNRADGDDYSFINYAGEKRFGMNPMMATVNLLNNGANFKIPVFLIQGELDILTSKGITRNYFDRIHAPNKEYILLPKTAHGFNLSVMDATYKILKNIQCL